jgi:hypothetical protein
MFMAERALKHAATQEHKISGSPLPAETQIHRGLWVAAPFMATVRGVDASGDRFEVAAVLETLGTNGLDMRLWRPVGLGARLFAVVRLSTKPDIGAPALRIAVRGRVASASQQHDEWYRVALVFERYRFLYACGPD